jgi:hypothetical protein
MLVRHNVKVKKAMKAAATAVQNAESRRASQSNAERTPTAVVT